MCVRCFFWGRQSVVSSRNTHVSLPPQSGEGVVRLPRRRLGRLVLRPGLGCGGHKVVVGWVSGLRGSGRGVGGGMGGSHASLNQSVARTHPLCFEAAAGGHTPPILTKYKKKHRLHTHTHACTTKPKNAGTHLLEAPPHVLVLLHRPHVGLHPLHLPLQLRHARRARPLDRLLCAHGYIQA